MAATAKGARTYIGYVDRADWAEISGWCFALDGAAVGTADVHIDYGDRRYRVTARQPRMDVAKVHGVRDCGFTFRVPPHRRQQTPKIRFGDSDTLVEFRVAPPGDFACRLFSDRLILLRPPPSCAELDLKLFLDGDLVAEERRRIAADGRTEIPIRIPAAARIGKLRGLAARGRVRVEANGFRWSSDIAWRPARVLIVSETSMLDDASRVYRCAHLESLLAQELFADTRVVSWDEFAAGEWVDYDAFVLARCGAAGEEVERVAGYKAQYATRVVYEVDDLIFLPWHRHDLGSVRSGVDDPDDPEFRRGFEERLNLLTAADAALTTTDLLARKVEALGLPARVLPNMVRGRDCAPQDETPSEALRILCMAGSPTHYRDFQVVESALEAVARRFDHVTVTLLGRFREDLPMLGLFNVQHVPRLPYDAMLAAIREHDLCVVPLEMTEFNQAKSCLKYVECGSQGVAVVASATADYRKNVRDNDTGFLVEDPAEWEARLAALVRDTEGVRAAGRRAHADVMRRFRLERPQPGLLAWIAGGEG
jgi:glycosyltransferase involved in cell wall biosynthesis